MEKVGDDLITRQIFIGLATSTDYLEEVAENFPLELLPDSARTIGKWCLEHFQKYGEAPGKNLETIYEFHRGELSKAQLQDIGELLESLSEDYETLNNPPNVQFLVDETRKYFDCRRMQDIADGVQMALEKGDQETANRLITSYLSVESRNNWKAAINILSKDEAWPTIKSTFSASNSKPLIRFGKALGRFWDDQFVRKAFIALLSPEKRGKSWLLLEVGKKGIRRGLNVAFFQAGDMSQEQQMKRMYTSITGRPFPSLTQQEDEDEIGSGKVQILVPTLDCTHNQTGQCQLKEREGTGELLSEADRRSRIESRSLGQFLRREAEGGRQWVPCTNCPKLNPTVWLEQRTVKELDLRSGYRTVKKWMNYKGQFFLKTNSSGTLTISQIKSDLSHWEKRNQFKPDIVIIDYADLIAAEGEAKRMDFRHQTNSIWMALRSLSEEHNCLVITATQAAATSYSRNRLKLQDFSEDKRKYAHVTAMYGLNQTEDEKKVGILRINQMVVREGYFHVDNQVHILQCLSIGKPILGSF